MARVFLSYSRKDEALVVPLEHDLEAIGLAAWIDKELTGGQPWWDRILQNIRECDVFLFALSSSSLVSEACGRELGYAEALGKPVLPVLIGDGVATKLLPAALSAIQFVDYRAQDKQAFIALSRAIGGVPAARALPEPLPEPPPVPLSYLSGLGARVAAGSLNFEQQSTLVLELKRGLRTGEDLDEVHQLLRTLRRRNDLLASVAQEIDEALDTSDEPQRPPKKPKRQPAEPSPPEPDEGTIIPGTLVELADASQRVRQLVAQLRVPGDCWHVRADGDTFVVLQAKDGRFEARVHFAAYFYSKSTKLQGMGWKADYGKSMGDAVAFAAVYCTLGCLLLNERFRNKLRRKVLARSWPAQGASSQSSEIAQTVIAALGLLAPAAQRYSLEASKGHVDEGTWAAMFGGG